MNRGERGAAVVMAMLVVAVTATLVAGVYWRQSVLVRQAENALSYAQARSLLEGAIDWAAVILREDARTTRVDHLGEPWAVPVADTRLGEDDSGDPVFVAGEVQDAQAKFNLRNLAGPEGVRPREVAAFRRLLVLVELNEALAEPVAQRVLQALAGTDGRAATLIALWSVEDLASVEGFGAREIERLRDFVTALPQPTAVNANTAPAEVLAARVEKLSLADARRLAASRDQAYFRDRADVLNRLGESSLQAGDDEIAVATSYFLVQGTVRYRRARLRVEALLKRDPNRTAMLWLREAA